MINRLVKFIDEAAANPAVAGIFIACMCVAAMRIGFNEGGKIAVGIAEMISR